MFTAQSEKVSCNQKLLSLVVPSIGTGSKPLIILQQKYALKLKIQESCLKGFNRSNRISHVFICQIVLSGPVNKSNLQLIPTLES